MPAAASVTTGAATDAAIASAAIPSTAAAGHTPAPATVAAPFGQIETDLAKALALVQAQVQRPAKGRGKQI